MRREPRRAPVADGDLCAHGHPVARSRRFDKAETRTGASAPSPSGEIMHY